MVAYVFFRKEVAKPRFEALKDDAAVTAENFGLKELDWWCETVAEWSRRWIDAGREVTRTPKYRGDDIVFVFTRGDKGRNAAHAFQTKCGFFQGIPCRGLWSES